MKIIFISYFKVTVIAKRKKENLKTLQLNSLLRGSEKVSF